MWEKKFSKFFSQKKKIFMKDQRPNLPPSLPLKLATNPHLLPPTHKLTATNSKSTWRRASKSSTKRSWTCRSSSSTKSSTTCSASTASSANPRATCSSSASRAPAKRPSRGSSPGSTASASSRSRSVVS